MPRAASRLPLALALALVALAPALARPHPASACSLVRFDVAQALQEYPTRADAIVVVEAVEEVLQESSKRPEVVDRWNSRVRTLATLKGETPDEFWIGSLGALGAACEGGPRLEEGDRALLMLDFKPIGGAEWGIVSGGQAVIRHVQGAAVFDHAHLNTPPQDIGLLGAVLQDIAGRVEAAPASVEAARQALLGAPMEAGDGERVGEDRVGHATGLIQVALVLAAGISAFAVALPILRWGNHSPE